MDSMKFKTIEDMSAYITHAINTPLTYIKGNLEHISEDIYNMPEGKLKDDFIHARNKMLHGLLEIEKVVDVVHSITKN